MAIKSIIEVVPGDVIIDGGNRTTVTKVEVFPPGCSSKVHINDKDCYESFIEVRVQDNNKEPQNA